MKKRMNIGGTVIEVEYEETYRPETIKIDGIEYSMERYGASHNGKTWSSSSRGNVLYYASENGQSYAIPQNKFTETTSEAQKRAQKKYDEANKDKFRMIHLKLNRETDADIIEKLEQSNNIQGYIKELIRADI